MSETFASLKKVNYQRFFLGALVSNVGSWVKNIAQSWLVLTILTNNSSTALGLVASLQFLAIPLLSAYGGAVADRLDKRKILLCTQLVFSFFALLMFWLISADLIQQLHSLTSV